MKTMSAARVRADVMGSMFLLAYVNLLPYACRMYRGLGWVAQYPPDEGHFAAGLLLFGSFASLSAIPLVAAFLLRKQLPATFFVSLVVTTGLLVFWHHGYDLAADAQAAIGLIFIPIYTAAITALATSAAAVVEWISGSRRRGANTPVPGRGSSPRPIGRLSVGVGVSVLALGLAAVAADAPQAGPARIGVYDSRAIAIAWAGSPSFTAWMGALRADHAKAKAAGDAKRVKQLEAEGAARQQRLHLQGFSTAPVDEILAHIKDALPGIQQQAGVSALVSKWDKEGQAKYPAAEQHDVTLALLDALHPSDRQRQAAIEAQKHKPIPLDEARNLKDW
jgi:hypothetical protein